MTKGLDEILSGEAPAQEQAPVADTPAPEPSTEPTAEQPRGPDGKFASKEPNEPETAPAPEAAPAAPMAEKQGTVPQQALHAAREKERAERERADRLELEMAELRGKVDGFAQARQPEPAKEPEKPVEFWDAPDKFVASALTPIQQEQLADRMTFSHELAVAKHGEDVVKQATDALKAAVAAGEVDGNAIAARLTRSRHPINEIVQWHKNSPAVREGELRQSLEAEIRAKVLAELGQQPPANPAPAAPVPEVMPSNLAGARNVGNRSGPAWPGPASINDIFDRSRQKAG